MYSLGLIRSGLLPPFLNSLSNGSKWIHSKILPQSFGEHVVYLLASFSSMLLLFLYERIIYGRLNEVYSFQPNLNFVFQLKQRIGN